MGERLELETHLIPLVLQAASGRRPRSRVFGSDSDIELTVTGLHPGEKLYEELLIGDNPKPTQHARIMKAHEQFLSWPQLEQKLNALSIAMSVNDVPVIRGQLQELVSGYQPSGEVVDWVHMALEREALANE